MSAVSRPPVNCPACGEFNEGQMAFCIICGERFNMEEPPQPVAPPPTPVVEPPRQTQSDPQLAPAPPVGGLLCTVCNRMDVLHAQFCIFCGGRTVPAEAPMTGRATYPSLVLDRQSMSHHHISGEYPYPTYQHQSAGSTFGMVVLFGFLGLIVGGGGLYLSRGAAEVDSNVVQRLWPSDGLVLYTEKERANVIMNDNDEKSFVFALTGDKGSLAVSHIPPGKYRVKVEGLKTKVANVNAGKVEVLGYPERIKPETEGF